MDIVGKGMNNSVLANNATSIVQSLVSNPDVNHIERDFGEKAVHIKYETKSGVTGTVSVFLQPDGGATIMGMPERHGQ